MPLTQCPRWLQLLIHSSCVMRIHSPSCWQKSLHLVTSGVAQSGPVRPRGQSHLHTTPGTGDTAQHSACSCG